MQLAIWIMEGEPLGVEIPGEVRCLRAPVAAQIPGDPACNCKEKSKLKKNGSKLKKMEVNFYVYFDSIFAILAVFFIFVDFLFAFVQIVSAMMCASMEIMIPFSNEIMYLVGRFVILRLNNITIGVTISSPTVEMIMMGPNNGLCNFPRCLNIF